ncbi:MAG: hypothetical protein LH471_01530 [Salinibacterium sp.]|nr:hypothetical protein [Salinibacterium sp.]
MSADQNTRELDSMPWFLGLSRAVPAVILALAITFSADHSARLGLTAFGAYAVISGLAIAIVAVTRAGTGTVRLVVLCQAAVAVVTGGAALAVMNGGYAYFVLLLSAYAAVCGFLELYLGARSWRRSTRHSSVARDWMFVGGLSVALAITALVIPANFNQPYSVEGVQGAVTASVALVGVFGAYLAIIGIYLAIGAFSLKWSVAPPLPQ